MASLELARSGRALPTQEELMIRRADPSARLAAAVTCCSQETQGEGGGNTT